MKSPFAAETSQWFCNHWFFLLTKAKWHLIAIANVHLCDCEYKWDCCASCSHGNTSGMWCIDWPWGCWVSCSTHIQQQGESLGVAVCPNTVTRSCWLMFSGCIYIWSLNSVCDGETSLSEKEIALISLTALILLEHYCNHSGDHCVMFQCTQAMHSNETWISVCCYGGTPAGLWGALQHFLPSSGPQSLLFLSFPSPFSVFLLFCDSITPHSSSLSFSY